MLIKKIDDLMEQQMLSLSVKDVFGDDFPIAALENKIALAEQVSCCVLKRMENGSSQRVKLACSKQKCPFSVKLELSPMGNLYCVREVQDKHNHGVSADKFEEKMLTGRLLKYSDFIYKTYFLTDSEFSSKPKLILKDLKQTHDIDLFSGNFNQPQKQKLKKKFDNIIQQLRLKRSKQQGSNQSDASQQLSIGAIPKKETQQPFVNRSEIGNIMLPHLQLNSSTSLQNTLQKSTNNLQQQTLNFDPSTACSSQRLLQSTQTLLPSAQNILQKQMSSPQFNFTPVTKMSLPNQPLSSYLPLQQIQQFQLEQQQQQLQQQQQQQSHLQSYIQLQQQLFQNNIRQNQQMQVINEDSPSVSGSLCKLEEFSEASHNANVIESEPRKQIRLPSQSVTAMVPVKSNSISHILPFTPSPVSAFPIESMTILPPLELTPNNNNNNNSSQFNLLLSQMQPQQQQQLQSNYLMQCLQQQQRQIQAVLQQPQELSQQPSNFNPFQNLAALNHQYLLNCQSIFPLQPRTVSQSSNVMESSIQNLLSQLQPNNSTNFLAPTLGDLERLQLKQTTFDLGMFSPLQSNSLNVQAQVSVALPQNH